MRILVLSYYFHPDLCAGSFRATALVKALDELAPSHLEIDVLSTLPNRYASYSKQAREHETLGRISISRIGMPQHRSDMLGQALAFLQYSRNVFKLIADRKYDLVFATSSRLMTAAIGARIAKTRRIPLYLDIRDIFVDTIRDVLPFPFGFPLGFLFGFVESATMRGAAHINLVSPGFASYFRSRYRLPEYTFFTNGIDDEFLRASDSSVSAGGERRDNIIRIVYAGNLGEGQAMHEIVPLLAERLAGDAEITVVGDGGRKPLLVEAAQNLKNVRILAPVQRGELIELYRRADVLFLHLGKHAAFEKVLPSKIFEYAATGKPILAGVGGFAAEFIHREITNAAVFKPGDASSAILALRNLRLADTPRTEFRRKFARSQISLEMAQDILTLLDRL